MRLDDLIARFASLPGANVGGPDPEKRPAEIETLVTEFPFLKAYPDYLEFLLRYGGASLHCGPAASADAFLYIWGFGEFADEMGADPVGDGFYNVACYIRWFYGAEAEATKRLVNSAPPGTPERRVHEHERDARSGKSLRVDASFGFPATITQTLGVYCQLYDSLAEGRGFRWFAPTFLDWLEIILNRGGLLTAQDLDPTLDADPFR